MILFLTNDDKMENTCSCLNIIKIEPNFWSLFYHDSIINIFCSSEQSTSHGHAHTFIELKKTIKVTKFRDFGKILRNLLWRPQGSLLCFLFSVSLFTCFDHFIGVSAYSVGRSMFSSNHGQQRRAFLDRN